MLLTVCSARNAVHARRTEYTPRALPSFLAWICFVQHFTRDAHGFPSFLALKRSISSRKKGKSVVINIESIEVKNSETLKRNLNELPHAEHYRWSPGTSVRHRVRGINFFFVNKCRPITRHTSYPPNRLVYPRVLHTARGEYRRKFHNGYRPTTKLYSITLRCCQRQAACAPPPSLILLIASLRLLLHHAIDGSANIANQPYSYA